MYNNSVFIDDSEVEETEDEVAKIKKWALQNNISQIALQELMNILRNKLLPQLPVSAKSFVGTKYTFNIENFVDPEEEHYQYVYFGLREGLLSCINTALHIDKVPLQINIDGIPLYKSSRKQLWPILCKVHHDPDIYKPFVVGIFCGYNKPKNINQYFRKFINEINTLQHDGLLISNRLIKPYIKCFVCDSPARSFLKGIKGHGGFSACERCTVHGERISNRTVYSEINALERTNESFRAQNDLEHHVAITPLLTIIPEIDMIKIFVLDSMHLGYIGVMKKLLVDYWMEGQLTIRMSRLQKKELSRRLDTIRKYIPTEFQRKIGALVNARKWKATEFRFFLLYCGPLVLKKILRSELYHHFLLLHVAFRILCSEKFKQYNNLTKIYLNKFFQILPLLYGLQSQVLNMHNLIHIPDDTINMNCDLNLITSFPFENYLGQMRKLIRTPNKPLEQICRRLEEKKYFNLKKPTIPKLFVVLKQNNNYLQENIIVIEKIKLRGLFTISHKRPDNCILLQDHRILLIKKIFYYEHDCESVEVFGLVLKRETKSVYQYPLESTLFQIWQIKKISDEIVTVPINEIKNKLIFLELNYAPLKSHKKYVIPLLHS
ncbi:hypothetical protein ALC57_05601 [Trachymyrmex cornetzi]|uniref:Transposase domain-containing protein n=1 Tax=Trachymyrmex cornetzi TaxID=471704 RepID=A0A151K356_9HYME|nr:hypothetical protein ALC57_05601 [Trachymyrmex cornetzi]